MKLPSRAFSGVAAAGRAGMPGYAAQRPAGVDDEDDFDAENVDEPDDEDLTEDEPFDPGDPEDEEELEVPEWDDDYEWDDDEGDEPEYHPYNWEGRGHSRWRAAPRGCPSAEASHTVLMPVAP